MYSSTFWGEQALKAEDGVPEGMRNELLKIAFDNATKTLACDLGEIVAKGTCTKEHVKDCAELTAKVCFDFVDAIMRERYERYSVLQASLNKSVEEALGKHTHSTSKTGL